MGAQHNYEFAKLGHPLVDGVTRKRDYAGVVHRRVGWDADSHVLDRSRDAAAASGALAEAEPHDLAAHLLPQPSGTSRADARRENKGAHFEKLQAKTFGSADAAPACLLSSSKMKRCLLQNESNRLVI
jgi:hypothetical protein